MKSPLILWLTVFSLFLPSLAPAALPQAVNGEPLPTLAPMLERTTPSVVNIASTGRVRVESPLHPLLEDPFFRRFFDIPEAPQERRTQNLGSGVVIDAGKGYIVTNNHVVAKAEQITVTLRDGRRLDAELIGTDPESDVAVIRVESDALTALPVGNSDELRVGDFVVAIGNPFGLGQTVTSGIVSALGRSGLGIEGYEDFIQTDASINPGNSGGALVNLHGELVGINTAILSQSGGNIGIGFAIPINMVRQITDQLVEFGEVRRGRLGVSVQDLTPELSKAFDLQLHQGAVVSRVEPGSPADKAGLLVGDVVLSVNERKVVRSADLRNVVGLLRVGETLTLEVVRNGSAHTLTAVIEETQQAKLPGDKVSPRLAGAVLGTIEEDSPVYGKVEGVMVLEVTRGTAAARAGLRPGDVILSANQRPVSTLNELQTAAQENGQGLLLNIQRGRSALFLLLK